MANVAKTETDDSASLYDLEYRASEDDAWYSVRVILDAVAETLTIKYSCSPQLYEVVFSAGDFETEARIEELVGRFRPVSRQIQDDECRKLSVGTTVCAAHGSGDDDLRFYDAVVDAGTFICWWRRGVFVQFCDFWKHGRGRDTLTSADIASLCFIEPVTRIDQRISDFAEIAKKKIASSNSISAATRLALLPNGSSNDSFSYTKKEESPHYRPLESSDTGHKHISLTYKTQAKISNYNQLTSQDEDMGPISCSIGSSATTDGQFFIIINNLEKDLTSSSIINFIYEKITILPKACVFPRQLSDPFARGAIMVDCQKKAQTIHEFLDNPNHLVVSSSGRPWVITKQASRGSIWNLIPESQKEIKRKGTDKHLKIVVTGTEAYRKAKLLKDLIIEFLYHESRVCERLVLAEEEILQSC